ncbi:protein ELC [Prunus yedoensis var. nudiflora]|uniref:Protein ELC n=1 Tax=Prunus yedoensis var. nudiflora TaxID=2094558 RepID=A0A314XYG9_PRUYE|nr:protein ELC [Prunus yedoensis var. nudiflora]
MDQLSGLWFYQSLLPKPNFTLQQKLIKHAITEIGEGDINYPIQYRPIILTDVIQLLLHIPSLGLTRGRFQKEEPVVLVIEGTIPIFYNGHPHKTPIKIWVPFGYPTDSPKVRVVVEDQAITSIKLPHPYVDAGAGGLVNVPYMQAWIEAHSERTLTGLCRPTPSKRVPPAPVPTFPIPQPPQEQEMQERHEEERHEQVMQERERQAEGKRCKGKRGRGWACGLL